jgi:hypothetical protein
MATFEGQAEKVFNKNGRWAILSDGNWYGFNRKQPVNGNGDAVTDGDFVKFEYEMNGQYRNVVDGTLKSKPGEAPPKQKRGGGGGDYQLKQKYWEDKEARDIDTQKRIGMAGALNTAITLINGGIELGFLTLPGGKKANFEAYTAAVLAEARSLYRTIQNMPEEHDDVMSEGRGKPEPEIPDIRPETFANAHSPESDEESDDWS